MLRRRVTNRRVDVAVVGAGPAGCATVIALERLGLRTLLLDRSRFRERRWGEVLDAEGAAELSAITSAPLEDARIVAPTTGVYSLWSGGAPISRPAVASAGGTALALRRPAFDRTLHEAARRAGAAVCLGARVARPSGRPGSWQLAIATDAGSFCAKARFVVDATGWRAAVARGLGVAVLRDDILLALRVAVPVASGRTGDEPHALLVEAAASGWWYSVGVPTARNDVVLILTALMTDPAAGHTLSAARFAELRERTQLTLGRSPWPEAAQPEAAAAPSQRLASGSGKGWAAVGDALVALDPLTGTGIGRALAHGRRLAPAIAAALVGETGALARRDEVAVTEYARYLRARTAHYAAAGRAKEPFWQRRAEAETPPNSLSSDVATRD